MKVKLCGIRTKEAAATAVDNGADFLGFIFAQNSQRKIKPEIARMLVDNIRGHISTVGVFQNQPLEDVAEIIKYVGLDLVQLHGDESPEYVKELQKLLSSRQSGFAGEERSPTDTELPMGFLPADSAGRNDKGMIIKVFRLPTQFDLSKTKHAIDTYPSDYVMIDRAKQSKGDMIDFNVARQLAQRHKLFYAGGLTPENVTEVIQKVQPYAVDVASGVETNGHHDLEKIKQFLHNAHSATP